MFRCQTTEHQENHAFVGLNARLAEGVRLVSRRSTLKAGIAGLAGLSLPQLLAAKEEAELEILHHAVAEIESG